MTSFCDKVAALQHLDIK